MKRDIVSHQYSRILFILFVFTLIFLSGCSVRLISSYDETTDRTVSALQRKVERFFVTIESQVGLPECEYANHKQFYNEAKVEISAIEVRARAIPDNRITIEQIELLKDSLTKLESLHKMSCLSKDQIDALRIAFNSSFTAILKLEIEKKRGES